jgi:hypothetical protein
MPNDQNQPREYDAVKGGQIQLLSMLRYWEELPTLKAA